VASTVFSALDCKPPVAEFADRSVPWDFSWERSVGISLGWEGIAGAFDGTVHGESSMGDCRMVERMTNEGQPR